MNKNNKIPTLAKIGYIFLKWKRIMQKSILKYKISLKQFYVMEQLEKKEYLYPSDIADLVFCDRPTATVIIKNLKKNNYINKLKDDINGKRYKVSLTNEGKKMVYKVKATLEKTVKKTAPMKCFSNDEKDLFKNLLGKMYNYFTEL